MVTCGNCGAQTGAGARFCGACGKQLSPSTSRLATTTTVARAPRSGGMAAIARDVQRLSTAMAATDGTLGDLLAMTPTEFEYFVGDLLTAHGYKNMQRVGGAGDMAADLLGHDPAGRTVIVQCKRYAPGQRIGSPVLQQFIGMMHVQHRAQAGVFVTTSGYTGQAIILAREHAITLIDGSDLVEMVHQARRSPGAGGRTVERSLNRASTKYTPI